ncbi:hypothetical protein [Mucilaginibacter flavidus]|uniref:hypothetical protein n=1 Tax=Mucilaginibacter flavidus TaxID=2949309 RepID=UPI002093058D|nr:hypothetical protein [Mucilaginibacter flavidus]MCO5950251.1 hypothetical protein [Mucilaginibacter flavidus]
MKQRFLILIMGIVLIITSCKKQSSNGPATGSTKLAGANGTEIYSGPSDPSITTGTPGDYYINLSTDMLFGPKTVGGWGTGVRLSDASSNAAAINAASASQLYNGVGAPAANFGAIGDFYLDTVAYLLYGPKTASGWGVPTKVQAPGTNAGVKTDVFSIGGSNWLWNSAYVYETGPGSYTEYFTRYYVRLNNTVTQDVLDNGMVLVYMQPSPVNNPNQWAPVPYQFDSSFGYTDNYVYVTSLGVVTLHYFFIQTDPSTTLPTLSTYNDEVRKFKIVTVTGQAGVFMAQHHVHLDNYQEVSRITGLWQQDAK